jgi:hypothetical protein
MVADDPQLRAGARLLHIGPLNGGSATETAARCGISSGSRDSHQARLTPPPRHPGPECALPGTGPRHSNVVSKYFP